MDPLREAARRDPRGPAVMGAPASSGFASETDPVEWDWQTLDRHADAAARRLTEAGVGPGERVATLLPASPEMVVLLHAVPRVGALLQPLNTAWTEEELVRALGGSAAPIPGSAAPSVGQAAPSFGQAEPSFGQAAPSLLLVPGDRVGALRGALPGVGTVAVEEVVEVDEVPDPAGGLAHRPALPPSEDDTPLAILLTSGSTGRPRPIPLTHGNLMASARAAATRLRLDPADRWLASLSPAHVGGLALLHRAAVVGSAVVTTPRFDAEGFLDLADRGEVTHASLVPVMLHRLLEARGDRPAPRGLRCVLLGGAATPRPLLEEALGKRWPVALTYGLTEATSQVATAPPDEVRRKPGAVGHPLPGVEVTILAPDAEGVGEVRVRGPTVALLPPGPSRGSTVHVDAAGWLHTGDLGRRDGDGDLWIVGRASDRIVSGGVTLEPGEVEAVLLRHPAVGDVAVVGVPDPEWGERVVAVVVPADPGAPPSLEEILDFARGHLSSAKRPRELRIRSALPRNANGKVERGRL
jgi:o-succinylbenzoate---CoA ligase